MNQWIVIGIVIMIMSFIAGINIGASLFSKEPVVPAGCGYNLSKETSMTEQVRLISSQWQDCDLSIDDSNQIGWKCNNFWASLPYTCQRVKIIPESQLPQPDLICTGENIATGYTSNGRVHAYTTMTCKKGSG